MEREPRTLAQIQQTIKAARDSVWVVEDTIKQLADGKPANKERKGNIDRIADLVAEIATGEAKLAEAIWPAEETN